MAGVVESGLDTITKIKRLFIVHWRKQREGGLGVLNRIERNLGVRAFSALALVPLSFVLGVFCLQPCGIKEHDLNDIRGGIGAIDSALETIAEIRGHVFTTDKPDISTSLQLLRQYRSLQESAQ